MLFGWVVSQFPMVVASNLYGTLKFSKKYQHKGCQTRKNASGLSEVFLYNPNGMIKLANPKDYKLNFIISLTADRPFKTKLPTLQSPNSYLHY